MGWIRDATSANGEIAGLIPRPKPCCGRADVIRWLSVFAVLGLATLAVTQFTSKRPVLKLRLLNNRTYASVIVIIMSVGMVLYDILYVLPQFLSGVAGYNAFQSGSKSAGGR